MLAMIAYPEKQRKCQAELDTVIGRSRMPTFADLNSLPYLRATLQEALRWRPVIPVGKWCPQWNVPENVENSREPGVQHCTTQVGPPDNAKS